jgi:phosphoglycolate phosphatase
VRRELQLQPPVVFDLDGTLIDSRADLAEAVNRMRASFDLAPLPVAEVVAKIGEGARRLVERALEDASGLDMAEALQRFLDAYAPIATRSTRPYPGIGELLAEIAPRRPLALLTNKPEAISRRILDGFGWSPLFAVVLGGDTLPVRKPDPAGLRLVAERTGAALAEVVLVGDTGIDAATAAAAGCRFVWVEWGFAREIDRAALGAGARAADAAALRACLAPPADRTGRPRGRDRPAGSPGSRRRH